MVAAIGIDLGTANIRAAAFRDARFEMIPHEGQIGMPSCVAFTERGRLIGQAAKSFGNIQPENMILCAVKLLGLPYNHPDTQETIKNLPYEVMCSDSAPGSGQYPLFKIMYKGAWAAFSPVTIVAMLLKRVKKDAEAYLGHTINNAVITVPTSFGYSRRFAIQDAALIAGINPLVLIHAPTAVLSELTFIQKTRGERNVLIYDVGATYVDVTLATLEEGIQEVKAVAGAEDVRLFAGDNIDQFLIDHAIRTFQSQSPGGTDITSILQDPRKMRRLKAVCESAKRQLSSSQEAIVEIENFHQDMDLRVSIARMSVEQHIDHYTKDLLYPIQRVLKDAKMDKTNVDEVILIGGSSRVPMIQHEIFAFFAGKQPLRCVNPEEAAARGAALQAAVFCGDQSSKGINEVLLLDILSVGLGVEIWGGKLRQILRRNTIVPTHRTEVFSTSLFLHEEFEGRFGRERYRISHKDDSAFTLSVFAGDRKLTRQCLKLGQAQMAITEAIPQDLMRVEVGFDVGRDHVLRVSIKDMQTGKGEKFTVYGQDEKDYIRIGKEEIGILISAEEKMDSEDDVEQKLIEAKNSLEELLYSIQGWTEPIIEERRVESVKEICRDVDWTLIWLESNMAISLSDLERQRSKLQQLKETATIQQANQVRKDVADEYEEFYHAQRLKRDPEGQAKSQKQGELKSSLLQQPRSIHRQNLPRGYLSESSLPGDRSVLQHASTPPSFDRAFQVMVQNDSNENMEEQSCYSSSGNFKKSASSQGSQVRQTDSFGVPRSKDHENQADISVSGNEAPKSLEPTPEPSTGQAPSIIGRSVTPRTAQQGLASLFTTPLDSSHRYTDIEIIQIATYLKNTGQPDWGLVPRLYTVLRLIDGLDLLDVFVQQGITDIWFPFGQTTLPRVLSPSIKANFLKYQEVVLSKSLLFEKSPERRHAAFLKDEPLPYEVVGKLGAGAHGQVDKVLSTISHKEYARKLFQRVRGMRKDAIKSFLTELQVLKRIQHYHCVELVRKHSGPSLLILTRCRYKAIQTPNILPSSCPL